MTKPTRRLPNGTALQSTSQVFVVRVWLETAEVGSGLAHWRGYITHAMSRQRQAIQDFDGMIRFMLPYLESMAAGQHLPSQDRGSLTN